MKSAVRVTEALSLGVAALSLGACSVGLNNVPLPAPGVGSDSYTIDATFTNALNLPAKAKVKVDGADVGQVVSTTAEDYSAVVTLRIRSGTVLPTGTTAELRSATPLGDVFVALTRPVDGSLDPEPLHEGSSIPESSTSAAATIEDVLTRASLLVNGGAIRNLAKTINGLGSEFGGRGDRLGELIAESTTLVDSLAARSDQIGTAMQDANTLADTVAQQQDSLNDVVSAAAPALDVLSANTGNITDLADRLGQIADRLQQYPSVNGTGQRSMVSDLNNLAAGMNAAAVEPNSDLSALNRLISVVGQKVAPAASAHADADVARLAIGALPDLNTPGSTEARFPDLTDWTNFVGAFAYTLQHLRDRVIGPGR